MRPPRAAPGAIRVSQPWGTIRSCVVNVITRRRPIAITGAIAEPRRANARRSCRTCVCASQKALFSLANERGARAPGAGGVSPRGFSPQVSVRRGKSSRGSRRRGSENDGGLTRGAPVERAFVHRECRRLRAPGAAGVGQAWCTIRSRVVNVITPQKPIAIAGAIPVPRRADARRSWETCICAPRMSLFFSEPAPCTKSGWRKPAVGNHPIVRGERNHPTKTDRHCRCDSRTTAG
jgi:hypothetical protein